MTLKTGEARENVENVERRMNNGRGDRESVEKGARPLVCRLAFVLSTVGSRVPRDCGAKGGN